MRRAEESSGQSIFPWRSHAFLRKTAQIDTHLSARLVGTAGPTETPGLPAPSSAPSSGIQTPGNLVVVVRDGSGTSITFGI